jgi:gas vesicle protein
MAHDDFSLDDDFNEDSREVAHGTRNFMMGIAVGALIGAGVALLYAPDRGSATRRRLGRRMKRLRNSTGESVQELKAALRKELRRVKRA